jgi:hypothetical protein
MSIQYTDTVTALNAVVATTTSDAYDFSKRQLITAEFFSPDASSGNGAFTIDASNDGTNWIPSIACSSAVSATPTTLVTSTTINAGTKIAGIIIPAGFRYYRMNVTRTTDGTYSGIFHAEG